MAERTGAERADVGVGVGPGALAWRRFRSRRLNTVALLVLAFIAAAVAAAGLVAPYPPDAQQLDLILARPDAAHWLGTDSLGRDVLSRVLHGGRISLAVGAAVALLAALVGTAVGLAAGYRGGAVDAVLMRLTDTLLALPGLVVVILLARLLGDGVVDVVLVLASLGWMPLARIVRAKVLALREQDFVRAVVALGAGPARVAVGHLLPNVTGEITVAATFTVVGAILSESTLSFLGLGVSAAHTATWGNMLGGNEGFVTTAPWLVLGPGLAIVTTVLCVNFVGEGLRDALDPHGVRT